MGFDLVGPLVESQNGNVWKLVGVAARTGVGSCEGIKNKSAKTVLGAIQTIMARIRLMHKMHDNVKGRFHSDMDKSFKA